MAPSTSTLWHWGTRKEALELLENLWLTGDDRVRDQLTEALLAGPPPDPPSDDVDEDKRQARRDRRVYDRIGILDREGGRPLTPLLRNRLVELRLRYPEWGLPDGDQARFNSWMEFGWGEPTRYSPDDLAAIDLIDDLIDVLVAPDEQRDGLLESWRLFSGSNPEKALSALETLSRRAGGGPADVWRATLWGLRDGAKDAGLRDRLIALVANAPSELFADEEFSRAVAELLQAASTGAQSQLAEDFWRLFDRAMTAATHDPLNWAPIENDQWVERAINRSMGNLAGAFFNGLFAYRLAAGSLIPPEQRNRLDRLIAPDRMEHRVARVIAASRLPYMFAVDPAWTREMLLPSFNWADETEAMAVWQGFAWQPRVAPDLWDAIHENFLAAFSGDRLRRFGNSTRTMAQLLMLAGIEFPRETLPTEQARAAIRAMTDEMRGEAIWWIWTYLSQESGEGGAARLERADRLWDDRVEPWLRRAWPKDPAMRTADLSDKFALMAFATNERFPAAARFVQPFLIPSRSNLLLIEVRKTNHPDRFPAETLDVMVRSVDLNEYLLLDDLANILQRMVGAEPLIRNQPGFQAFDQKVRARLH
jgi:hypothetical protein